MVSFYYVTWNITKSSIKRIFLEDIYKGILVGSTSLVYSQKEIYECNTHDYVHNSGF